MGPVAMFIAFAVLIFVVLGLIEEHEGWALAVMFVGGFALIYLFGKRQQRKAKQRLSTFVRAVQGDEDAAKKIASDEF